MIRPGPRCLTTINITRSSPILPCMRVPLRAPLAIAPVRGPEPLRHRMERKHS